MELYQITIKFSDEKEVEKHKKSPQITNPPEEMEMVVFSAVEKTTGIDSMYKAAELALDSIFGSFSTGAWTKSNAYVSTIQDIGEVFVFN